VRIGLQTWGSEGDIRPFLALSAALVQRGHEVRVVVTELDDRDYTRFGADLGIDIRMIGTPVLSSRAEMTAAGEALLAMGNAFRQGRYIARHLFEPSVPAMFDAAGSLAEWSDVVVRHFFHYPAAVAAELAGVPQVSVSFSPDAIPSADQPPGDLSDWGPMVNRLLWRIAGWALDRTFLPPANRLREREGLAPIQRTVDSWYAETLNLVAISPVLRPPSRDWAPRHSVCGFLDLPDAGRFDPLPADVEAFLAAGPAPVFVGFGSLTPKDESHVEETLGTVEAAVRRAGCRAIVQGLRAPGLEGETMLNVGRLPHAEVFRRCAAIVHHAGAGTTQTALSAGVPSVCVPHIADQFYWGRRLHELGVAAAPLKRSRLNAGRLSDRIRTAIADADLRERSAELGAAIGEENAADAAARLLEQATGG